MYNYINKITIKIKRMNNNFKTEIDNVNQIFENVVSNYKSNYVNYHTNATLSLTSASLVPVSETPTSDANEAADAIPVMGAKKPRVIKQNKQQDPNDDALLKYRYAANNLLEKVRSQINSNSKQMSTINTNITPIQKQYLQIMETGTELRQTKLAAVASLEDYNELYKTTVFSTLMYVAGSAMILYLMYKPKIQSQY